MVKTWFTQGFSALEKKSGWNLCEKLEKEGKVLLTVVDATGHTEPSIQFSKLVLFCLRN